MKPSAQPEYRGPYRPIATTVPGFRVCELMPRLARLADRYAIIRSMTHRNGDHGSAMHAFLGGNDKPAGDAPYFGSVISKLRPATGNVPSYVWLQDLEGDSGVGGRYLTGGSLGAAHAPLRVGQGVDNPCSPKFQVRAFDGPRDVPPQRVLGRRELLAQLDPAAAPIAQTIPGDALGRLREKAFDLITGPEARQAFNIAQEPAKLAPALRDALPWAKSPSGAPFD